jgi:hypothetical protein
VAIRPDFDIILRQDSNLASLDCPRFRKSRVEKEIEKREVTVMVWESEARAAEEERGHVRRGRGT